MPVTVWTKSSTNGNWVPGETYSNSRIANEACGKMKAAAEAQGLQLFCKMERK